MFKNTTHFFRKVYNDIVPKIDQDNYVRLITDNHNLEKLKTLYFDLEIYISNQIENLECNIHSEQIQIKIEEYKKTEKEVPYKTLKNIKYEIAQRKNLSLDGISETIQILDLDTMFYGLELYPIRKLKIEIGLLIRNLKKQQLEKESRTRQEQLIGAENFKFENKFDEVDESKVIEYFVEKLVNKKFLTKETLDSYLKQAFELNTPPEKRFSFANNPTKERIKKAFYGYYNIAGSPYGQQKEYLNLLCNYFTGYEKLDPKNFSR